MRLINVQTGVFEEFIGRNIPKYAILSHTWEEEEVSFKMMSTEPCQMMVGYRKIAMSCTLALNAGLGYTWIDTCCIDKSSSAELTEAINSMFRWYQRSEICYVFLSDLEASASLDSALEKCRWFTRGWTLQELIAPRNVLFFDKDWNYRGSKQSLVCDIARITGISAAILEGAQLLSTVVVAQKMAWAAHRETTRIEDTAYCLLGIFNVNMPLLYGEEDKAFRRLQEEIIRSTADLSIFAWTRPDTAGLPQNTTRRAFCGVLADSPACFAECLSATRIARQEMREVTFSNAGVKLRARIHYYRSYADDKRGYQYVWRLDCARDGITNLGVRLRKFGPDQFVREDPWSLLSCSGSLYSGIPRERYFVSEFPDQPPGVALSTHFIAQARASGLQMQLTENLYLIGSWPRARYDGEDQLFYTNTENEGDSAIARICISLPGLDGEMVDFEAMFIAVGWAQGDVTQFQGTIVDYEENSITLKELVAEFSELEHSKDQVIGKLRRCGIPRAHSSLFKVPETDHTVIVSFTPSIAEDPEICSGEFWRIAFHYTVYKTEPIPSIEYRAWGSDYSYTP